MPLEKGLPDVVGDLPGTLLLQCFAKLVPELLMAHLCTRDADHREFQRQPPLGSEVVEGRNELARGKVPRGAEDHHNTGFGHTREPLLVPQNVL
jgi:hypothetical protein